MKKFIFILILMLFFALNVQADTMPFYKNSVPQGVLGFYQVNNELILHSDADENSNIIKKMQFSYDPETMPENVFAVLFNAKKLGFLYVTDIGDDNWVQVIYDKRTRAKGWVKSEDIMQFLPLVNFYNLYGKKYGLILMKDAPDNIKNLHAKSETNSQAVSKINYAKKIKLTAIRGNWALVTVLDLDKTPKTGYLRWRGDDGTIYAFPNIK